MHEPEMRKLCGDWPGVSVDLKWDHDLVFSVAGKMFCVLALDGPSKGQVSFKVDNERFLELTDRPGFHPAPYLARAHWVAVAPSLAPSLTELASLIERSYRLVAAGLSKKLQRELGLLTG